MIRSAAALLLATLLAADSADFQGRKLHYTLRGEGPRTLVLIHGWTCDGSFWSANVANLAKRYRVLTLDLPGHGRSGDCATCSMEEFSAAVFAVMDAAKVRRGVLVGHSMGGAVMLACARRAPERVEAIVAVDAAFPDATSVAVFKDSALRFAGPEGTKAREAMIRAMFTPATPKAVQEQVLKGMLGAPEATAVGAMRGMFTPGFWKDDIVRIPFLEIAAGNSSWLTLEGLQKRFPGAQLKRIEGTGHFLMMEQPEAFNRILLDWLGSQRP